MAVDILKITSPIPVKNKVHDLPKQLPSDVVFDITNPNLSIKNKRKTDNSEEQNSRKSLLQHLNKQILEPLMTSTNAQSDSIRRLVLMAKYNESSTGVVSESFFDNVFVKPQDLLGELLRRDNGGTVFKGEFFDSLRILSKLEGQSNIKNAIISILKYFDCYVNQENSINSILKLSNRLLSKLPIDDGKILNQNIDKLNSLRQLNNLENKGNPDYKEKAGYKEIKSYLKNEFIPLLGSIINKHQSSNQVYNQVMSIIHNIVRYDKADPKRLEEAVMQLGEELKLLTNLTEDDVLEMKKLIFEHGKQIRDIGESNSEEDLAAILSKTLEKSGPSKINNVAQNLLLYMVQSESPVLPLLHYVIPFHYLDENIYGEFFIDKDCQERRGDAKEAKNIFFIIQSDKYGNFEIDLLARDKKIDLEISCPDNLVDSIKDTKTKFKNLIEEQGYRLANYQVGACREGKTILQKFPKLGLRKVGLDVKV